MTLVLTALAVLLAGMAIGATSVGGVILVPALVGIAHLPADRAIAAASFAFSFTGLIAFLARPTTRGSVEDPETFDLYAVAAAAAGAAAGAGTLDFLPTRALSIVVALLAIGSGLHALVGQGRKSPLDELPRRPLDLRILAFGVGALSAWSGTGGPVVLLPLLTMLRWPTLAAVEAAQRVQLPVAAAATVVNASASRLDYASGAVLGALLIIGWLVGRALSRRVPVVRLRQVVGLTLIGSGLAHFG